MKKDLYLFFVFLFCGTFFLSSSFYNNGFKVVEDEYYLKWEKTYERVVIARLAKSQQDGVFSAAGLLGLVNTNGKWTFEADPQYKVYENGEEVNDYLAYKSNPGIQGIVFSFFDLITDLPPKQNIIAIRIITSILSALTISLLCAWMATRFGSFSAIFILLFSATSQWMILPASNAYWNLWVFYLPFVTGVFLVTESLKNKTFNLKKITFVIFIVSLLKVYFTGFEMITTTLIMNTVPFVFLAIYEKWKWKVFLARFSIVSTALLAATAVGLATLALQIAINDQSPKSAYRYIEQTIDRRALGSPEEQSNTVVAESMNVSAIAVIQNYLEINAFTTKTSPRFWQVSYKHLIILFGLFSFLHIGKYGIWSRSKIPQHGVALIISTWYSIAAPLSWYIIFKPTSYIHTFLFPMAWQMPFTLLGFALCGYVISDLIKG